MSKKYSHKTTYKMLYSIIQSTNIEYKLLLNYEFCKKYSLCITRKKIMIHDECLKTKFHIFFDRNF